MRLLTAAAVLALSGCASSGSVAPAVEFQSWYHGYFQHSVFGLGTLSEYEGDPYVLCGSVRVPVRAVFDTHMLAGQEPKAGQSQADAASHNQALLEEFSGAGITCKIPAQWAKDA